jgi:glycosyltransferase involved in cell wall biosynthesis
VKITYLAAGHSIHTVRWINALSDRGHDIGLITLHPPSQLFPIAPSVKVRVLPIGPPAGYFLNGPVLRRILRDDRPELLHAHYASGYGTLSRLAGFAPSVLSVWGSDVYDFPYQSKRKQSVLRKNLEAADAIWTTSRALEMQTARFLSSERPIQITPFGIDCLEFTPSLPHNSGGQFVVGTVKALEPAYGIDRLLTAFALLKRSPPAGRRPRLIIAGEGSLKPALERLTHQLGIAEETDFIGAVPHEQVPSLLNSFSVFTALSVRESFGVAVLEASACGLPVIVSDAGGLPEVVIDGSTGFVIPDGDPEAAFRCLKRIAEDEKLALALGEEGRRFVQKHYEWTENVSRAEEAYLTTMTTFRSNADS